MPEGAQVRSARRTALDPEIPLQFAPIGLDLGLGDSAFSSVLLLLTVEFAKMKVPYEMWMTFAVSQVCESFL